MLWCLVKCVVLSPSCTHADPSWHVNDVFMITQNLVQPSTIYNSGTAALINLTIGISEGFATGCEVLNCSKTALSNRLLVSSSSGDNRQSLFRWDCSFCSFSLRSPSPLWSFHNLEPSKLEGCRLALRECVEARCQDVECLSTLSVLCLVVALSDCI